MVFAYASITWDQDKCNYECNYYIFNCFLCLKCLHTIVKVSKSNEAIAKHWLSLSSKWYFSNVCNDESSSQKAEEEDEDDEDSDDDENDGGIMMSKSSHVVSLDVSDVLNAKKCHDATIHPYCSLCNQHPEVCCVM